MSVLHSTSQTHRPSSWRWVASHVLFWGGVFGFFVFFFGREAQSYGQSLLFVTLLLPVAMGTTYALTHILVPRYLLKRRYGRFALYGLYIIVVSVYLELLVLIVSFIYLARYDVEAMNPATLDVFGLVVALYVVVFLAMAANLTARWHQLRDVHIHAEKARLEAELERLETQMNPHFLFNTLNNLYGLVLDRSEDAPDVILRLADMLDYMLYRSDETYVPLSGEIEHLRTYLELERLRFGERVHLQFDCENQSPNGFIAPLLLVPLVENAFKHGLRRVASEAWVHIQLNVEDERIRFHVQNSKPQDRTSEESAPRQTEGGGIGLMNLEKRLDLLYSDTYELELVEEDHSFSARLELPIRNAPDADRSQKKKKKLDSPLLNSPMDFSSRTNQS